MKNIKSKNVENDVLLDDEPIIENKNIKINKKKILSITIIIALLVLIIGVTYAIYNNYFFSKEYSIKTGTISMEFLETNDFISIQNALPMGDIEGKKQTNAYDFNVITEAAGDVTLSYVLYLEKLEVDTGYTKLEDNEVKFYLTDENDNPLVEPILISKLDNPFYVKTNIHSKTNTRIVDAFKIRVWIDKDVYPTGWENNPHQYKFKIGAKIDDRLDKSGANKPVLSANMIPVYYDEACDNNIGCWRKADKTNTNEEYKWYDYDSKIWANSVTVSSTNRSTYKSATPGTKIPMEDILTMQVWIPRYKYKVWNYNLDGTTTSEPQEIQITFEKETAKTGEITCIDDAKGTSNGSSNGNQSPVSEICKINNTNCTNAICNNKTYTHPAFTFGDKELTGIWVGKFELSSDRTCNAGYDSAVGSGCNLNTIKPFVKPNLLSWRGAMVGTFENNIMKMNDSNNKYGFASTDDTHMIKNTEWASVAYLSHSKYGINKEIELNSANTFTTGCGPQSKGNSSSGSTCNSYNTNLGLLSSTTGNIYGIYDMSGGANEFVMGNIVAPNGTSMMSGYQGSQNYYSGFTGTVYYGNYSGDYAIYNGSYPYPDAKYVDKYSFNTASFVRSRSKLGDAMREVYNISSYGWYSDYSEFIHSHGSWVVRGGYYENGGATGIFYSGNYSGGNAFINGSSRLVISQ